MSDFLWPKSKDDLDRKVGGNLMEYLNIIDLESDSGWADPWRHTQPKPNMKPQKPEVWNLDDFQVPSGEFSGEYLDRCGYNMTDTFALGF